MDSPPPSMQSRGRNPYHECSLQRGMMDHLSRGLTWPRAPSVRLPLADGLADPGEALGAASIILRRASVMATEEAVQAGFSAEGPVAGQSKGDRAHLFLWSSRRVLSRRPHQGVQKGSQWRPRLLAAQRIQRIRRPPGAGRCQKRPWASNPCWPLAQSGLAADRQWTVRQRPQMSGDS